MSLLTKMQFKLDNLLNQVSKLIPSASGKMLYNKWVLYFIFVVGIYDVIHFYQKGNTVAVAIFFIVGFLTSFFSKNMIVIIVSAIAVSHIVAYGNKMSEGFEEGEEEEGFEEGEEEEGFAEGVEGEEGDSAEETPDPEEKNLDLEEKNQDLKEKKSKKKKSDSEDKNEKFTDGTAQLLADMNKLLQQTENVVKTSITKGVDKQGFTTMSYSEYK
jgi:hypothetical protein